VIGLCGTYNERGDFLITTMPYVDEDVCDTGTEKVFPHIVSGDGYSTRCSTQGG